MTAAVRAGVLDVGRLESFRKLAAEQRYQESKLDRAAQAESKRNARLLSKAVRSFVDKRYERK